MKYKKGYYTRRWGIKELFEIEPYKIHNYYLKYKSGTLIGIIHLLFSFFFFSKNFTITSKIIIIKARENFEIEKILGM